jgi:Phage terminase large subunit
VQSRLPTKVIWRPQAGPQKAYVDCPFAEVFLGGARGGGKTDAVLGKWALEEQRYGERFNAIGFRRTTVSFEDAVERAKQIYIPLGAKFTDKPARFRMPNGGRVGFGYLDNLDDAHHQQGKNLTHAWIEEAGQYPGPEPIDRLFGALRSVSGVPIQLTLTGNPGGAGQHWIAKRYGLIPFPRGPKVVSRKLPDGSTHRMAVIPSRITDNKLLIQSDPKYVSRLQLVGSPALVKAWLEGDWSAIDGAFFPEWSTERHVISPFTIPSDWLRFRSADWGSARPFSIGWWAVVGDDYSLSGQLTRDLSLPRGALIRYREWYGSSSPNVGLKLSAEEVADGVREREIHEPHDRHSNSGVSYGVMDPAAFASDGGPSIAERMADHGVNFRRADNKRVRTIGALGGWDQVRSRLIGTGVRTPSGAIDWSAGAPMIYLFSTCVDSIRTLPVLQHDRDRPEDVDTDSEDHAPDEIRYACMSRPWINEPDEKKEPRFLQDAVLEDLWEDSHARSSGRI